MAPWGNGTLRKEGNGARVGAEKVKTTSSTGTTGDDAHSPPEAIPAPDSPSHLALVPTSPRPPMQRRAPESSFGRNCGQRQAPVVDRTQYEELTRG